MGDNQGANAGGNNPNLDRDHNMRPFTPPSMN